MLAAHATLVGAVVLSSLDYLIPVATLARLMSTPVYTAGYPTVPGAVVLLLAALGFLGPHVARRAPATKKRFLAWWTTISLLTWGAAFLAYQWMSANADNVHFSLDGRTPTSVAVTAVVAATVVLLVLALIATAATNGRYAGGFLGLALLAVPLTMIAGLVDRSGALPAALRVGVPWLLGTAALIALARLTATAVEMAVSKGGWVLVALGAAALAYPVPRDSTDPVDVTWYTAVTFALKLDAVLPAFLLGALGFALHRARKHESAERPSAAVLRWRGLGVGFIVLAGAYSFGSQPSVLLLLAAGAFTWWLFPAGRIATAAGVSGLSEQDRRRALALLVKAGEARRVLASLRKGLRDKVAAGDVPLAEASSSVLVVEREAAARDDTVEGVSVRDRAFGTLGGVSPWERARWGAVTGAVVGLPWTAFALYGVATTMPTDESYPVLNALAVVVPQLVRWTAYGTLFGYFLPLLRGSSSLAKALCLFVAVSVPTIADIVPRGAGTGGWQAILLVVVQTVSFAMTLGLLADRRVLRSHGHDGSRLADVHNLGAVAAWASSLAVSAGTALATALLVGLQPFIVGTVQPADVPAPPSVSAPR